MTSSGRPLDRRTVLRGLGLTTLVAMSASSLACDTTEPTDKGSTDKGSAPSVLDLSFDIEEQFRPFALVSPGFEQVRDSSSGSTSSLVRTAESPVAPFVAVELSVTNADRAEVVAGLLSADGDQVAVVYSADRQQVSIEVHRGADTRVVGQAKVQLQTPFTFAFALCENQVTALVDDGGGWQPVLTNRDQVAELIDLRDPKALSGFTFGYGARNGEVGLGAVTAGPFGMVGVRDPHLVQRPDGTPYVRDGLAYLTFTCAGLGFFQQAHWGVFTLDLEDPTKLTQVAHLYTSRDGLLVGDHAGQVIVDEPAGQFTAFTSSWGDFDGSGVHVRHAVTSADVLAGVHLLETEPLALPTKVSSWDPAVTRIDDKWHVAFVESPSQDPFDFHPALATGPSGSTYDDGLQLIGADTSRHQCEGPILQQIEGKWYLLASDGDQRQYRVYDLSVKSLGALDAPYGTNIPHPQLIPRPGGGYLMVTFDGKQYAEDVLGYGGHGDVIIMSSQRS